MDLRSIINDSGNDSSKQQQTPATPTQAPSQQQYREYSQGPTPGSKLVSQDHGQHGELSYGQSPYPGTPYAGRPSQPPPIQTPSHHDVRSPGASSQYSAQSPYRAAPAGAMSAGYPFPQSPAQHQAYGGPPQHREAFSQNGQPPAHLQHQNSHQSSYGQPSPQTPTIGPPGPAYPYPQHQRSQSVATNSTPTSAQSQPSQHPHYQQESPVITHAYPPQTLPQHYRQQSQPGTPLGPPISIPRQPSGGFQPPPPSSPYQQRVPSNGVNVYNPTRASPAAQPPSNVQRQPSTPSAYHSHRSSLVEEHRLSQSSRERSLSVSPKTQIYSISRTSMTPQPQVQAIMQEQQPSPVNSIIASPQVSNKRKMADREPSESMSHASRTPDATAAVSSPHQPMKKRRRYAEPPIWAQSYPAFKKSGHTSATSQVVNGAQPTKQDNESMLGTNGHPQIVTRHSIQTSEQPSDPNGPLGMWEQSILGADPLQEVPKQIADWLYINVVDRPDMGELQSRGVEIEIEAKLGTLTDMDSNQRIYYPVTTECLLDPQRSRVSFHSSMSEAQHQNMNEFLNAKVVETHPGNTKSAKARVPIVYTHRRERDSFFELPKSEIGGLPATIRNEIQKSRHPPRVRITYDQKTGQELAKIIKVRVSDRSLYLPSQALDCRISVNLEMRYDGQVGLPAEGTKQPDRNKDRLSYKQSHYQIDLTQVTTADTGKPEKEHELEIELSGAAVIDQGRKAGSGQPHKYPELIEGFINNIRVLARAVPAGEN